MQYKIFGCKVNKYYAEEWLKTSFFQDKEGIFLLSCVVTDKAKKKWVKFVFDNIKNLKENEKIYISGCGSLDKGEKLQSFFEIYKELEKYKEKIEILPEKPEKEKREKIKKLQINKLTDGKSGIIEKGQEKSIISSEINRSIKEQNIELLNNVVISTEKIPPQWSEGQFSEKNPPNPLYQGGKPPVIPAEAGIYKRSNSMLNWTNAKYHLNQEISKDPESGSEGQFSEKKPPNPLYNGGTIPEKSGIPKFRKNNTKLFCKDETSFAPLIKGGTTERSRGILSGIYTKKFILIQSGCDSYCTYCLTVQKRGKHFFREKDEIIEDIKYYEKSGGKEIVLTGINIGAWGLDSTNEKNKRKLSNLLEEIIKKTHIPRIRISSLGIEFVDDKLLKIFENKRIYPHFHYSIQSGSSKILKLMGRHYTGDDVKNVLEKTRKLKRDDGVLVSIGADIIIGFSAETEADFIESCKLVSDYQITKLHAFSFSAHKYGETVPASNFLNQIDEKTKKERYNKITEIGEKVRQDFIKSQTGKEFEVLVESVRNGKFKGWTQNYIDVTNDNFEVFDGIIKKNEIVKGKLKKFSKSIY